MRRIYLNSFDRGACSYYRAKLPVRHCTEILKGEGIELACSEGFSSADQYDAFVFKVVTSYFLPVYQDLKAKGKKLIINLDDDLWHIPTWNPAAHYHGPEVVETINHTLDLADQIWVSTEPLAEVVREKGWGKKVRVLPNLIDPADYPEPATRTDDKIRVLWAGSVHHDADINLLVPVVESLAKTFPNQVEFLFFGDYPAALCEKVRIRHVFLPVVIPRRDLGDFLLFVDPVDLSEYPATLCGLAPDIALCPLVEHKFNNSKSGIKAWECSLAGASLVVSDEPPYSALPFASKVREGYNWIDLISSQVEVGKLVRKKFNKALTEHVKETHSWNAPAKNLWLDAFRSLVA